MTFQPRDYQVEAVQSVYTYFEAQKGDAPIVVAPTGSGKALMAAMLMQRAVADFPGTRILLLTHVKELILQDFKTLMKLWPNAPAGIYSASLNRRNARAQLLFAGVQSVYRKAKEIGYVDFIIIDEAHLVPPSGEGQYRKIIEGLRDINPNLKIVGMTATPYRLSSGRLDVGDGAIFDGICYDIPIHLLVGRGYLCPLISKRPGTVFDLNRLPKRMGDYSEKEMANRFVNQELTDAAVSEIMAAGQDRKSWLVFCINVDHAEQVRDAIRSYGVSCEMITGKTAQGDRDRLTREYQSGKIRCLTSVNVISTGFDAPQTDLLALMRPTQSLGLYLQQAGRGMRIADGKENCLVLDFAQAIKTHGPVDAVMLPDDKAKGKGDGEAPTKTCPTCSEIVFAGARECGCCGYEFPPPEIKIEHTASTAAIMNMTAVEDWRPVTDFAVALHKKPGGDLASMRAEYLIDGKVIKEWVCFDHAGFPRQQAVRWWQQNAGTTAPESVADALSRQSEIRPPAEAVVRREGKYDRVVRVRGMMPDRRVA